MRFHDSRREFLKSAALGTAALGMASTTRGADSPKIQGFEEHEVKGGFSRPWKPVSDRKLRVGIVGYGVCKFGAAFSFQNHPNVEVVAVSDLFPDRCQELARVCKCERTYPSLEKLVLDDSIEAVFVATDAPSHCNHVLEVLKHGKHAACAVPAVFASLEDADRLFEAVNSSGLNYMLFETSYYHDDVYAMRQVYRAGGFGKLVYTEGEYYHFGVERIDSYKNWRDGLPPQYYPTHSNGYYVGVSGGSFTEVSCLGMPSILPRLQADNNVYKNPFGTEIALMRTSEGGMARMAVSWDTPGFGGEVGRVRGQKGSMTGMSYEGLVFETPQEEQARLAREKAASKDPATAAVQPQQPAKAKLPDLRKPGLPPGVHPGGHGGSHGYLCDEFVTSILEKRTPEVDVAKSLNMTVAGIVSHQSALKDGELMKIPQYKLPG